MSTPTYTTTVADQIAAARARLAEKRQAELEIMAEVEAENAAIKAELHQRLLAKLAAHLPDWVVEHVQLAPDFDYGTSSQQRIKVALPGCSPIIIRYYAARETIDEYEVYEPLRLVYDPDFWWVKVGLRGADDLDEAVDIAASYGESWHEMSTEAARRNEQCLRPEPPAPPLPSDMALAGQLLKAYSDGKLISERDDYDNNDDGNVLTGALLYAIGRQLERIAAALEADHG
jgi:hypothetical protein